MRPIENVRFLRDRELGGLEIAEVRSSAHAFPNHTHDCYAVGMMEAGGSYCLGTGRSDTFVGPGQIALINPGQVHSGVPPDGARATYRMFYLAPRCLGALREEAFPGGGAPEFSPLVTQDPGLARQLGRLARLVGEGGERLAKDTAMVLAFSRLLERNGTVRSRRRPGREHRAVRQAREFLAENLSSRVSLEDLAAETGLSRYHLLRVFKNATGVTPHAFHTQQRIERAKELLRQGWPIAEVALETGFVDQSHFSNTFRQLVGATPGQYQLG